MNGGNKILETVSVTMRFGGLTALDGVTYSIREGEVRGIIGPNGAGKTTLFNVITGELKPTSGKIFLRGKEISSLPPHAICQEGLGRTFQLTFIFPEMTVYDSIWVGVNSRARRPWNPFILAHQVDDFSQKTKEICHLVGLEEKMNELASNLSYGDQKILEIAMALSTRPSILLLDEPTQGVSPQETDNIAAVIEKLSKRITIILIEHSMDVVLRLCSSITVLNEGRVVAEGSPKEISKNEEVQRVYLGEAS
ncbi:MAG TPA: ABC transporter ATP-binding protein [Thermodesulfobacteriota bacterium]|nr:ABC transporter ATP-binding protein [Thermodesulfobacteriota bacterium]